ncbi:hypothetical protein [Rubrivirga sp. IMCC45206]|uniref:hypothetical protein n=1 Tax=Rubrivirga sp. IMCC45206 TaxID=3391614 RepID=UPI00398FCEF0
MPTATPNSSKTADRRTPSSRQSARKARRGSGTSMPSWADLPETKPSSLAKSAKRATAGAKKATKVAAKKARRARPLDAVPSLRFGLLTLAVCAVLTLFLGHAYATRATLDDLQDARRANERLRLTHQRLQGDVDRMIGPRSVLARAASLGLEEGAAYGPTIKLGDE